MNIVKGKLTIRNATPADAPLLCSWWNDGAVMAHAGFPNGLGTTVEKLLALITTQSDATTRRHIMEYDGQPIGEMNYHNKGNQVAEMGIKICIPDMREKGLGTTMLSIYIDALFNYYGYEKVILDANTQNKRAQHVYENKIGFQKLQVRENAWQDQLGNMQSCIDYELTKTQWLAQHPTPLQYIHLRPERPDETQMVESISREAHWDNGWDMTPKITDVHLLVNRLRQCPAYVPALHYVAEVGGTLVGNIIYSTCRIVADDGTSHQILTFGPLSVLPAYQGQGIGKALLGFTRVEAARLGYKAICIFGHPDYYPRVGFRPASQFGITNDEGKSSDACMALPLYENALEGIQGRCLLDPVYQDIPQTEVDAFDKNFPPKAMPSPVSIDVLLDRLDPPAQKALEGMRGKSLAYMQTKSVNALSSLEGIDAKALDTIYTVLGEHGRPWGNR